MKGFQERLGKRPSAEHAAVSKLIPRYNTFMQILAGGFDKLRQR